MDIRWATFPAPGIFVLPHLEKTPYDTLKDFKPIIQYGAMNFGVVVQAESPYKTWKDIAEAGEEEQASLRPQRSPNTSGRCP